MYTKEDCKEIKMAIDNYKKQKNTYPSNLSSLISNNPMRQNWSKDRWEHNYSYAINSMDSSYTLISAGKDGKFGTKDDLIYKND
ncbi:hypothetical protein DVR12_16645 [Chitinophaga silvatica]|uniref:Type II secretion system protein GspG C-terminal domain-containing protein n=1 Tax=Chitinophaga silvatica TaxID=2282649 RepID=A0A3E1Y7C4_9BACT|nr:type II secretion system protein GspG [Chitinophaga silvatica]RFS20979.1 hypothetical protein DVR12_16645 [Chitinophaga silvatica]